MTSLVQDIVRKRHGNREDLAMRLCLLSCFGSCFEDVENGGKISVTTGLFVCFFVQKEIAELVP